MDLTIDNWLWQTLSREKGVEAENRPKGKAELIFGTKTLQKGCFLETGKTANRLKGKAGLMFWGQIWPWGECGESILDMQLPFTKLTLRTIPPWRKLQGKNLFEKCSLELIMWDEPIHTRQYCVPQKDTGGLRTKDWMQQGGSKAETA